MVDEPAGGTRRDASLWVVSAALLACVVVGLVVGTRAGAWALAGVMAACAVARALLPEPPPAAIGVRRRWLDVAVQGGLAILLAALATVLPD